MPECYDEWWLPKDMDDMGYMFEYCDSHCRELYNVSVDKIKLMNAFMRSKFRKEMEEGHPKFLSQASADSIKQWIDVDYKKDLSAFAEANPRGFEHNQMFWVGWIYAYIHFMSKLPSAKIVELLPIEYMLDQYYTGHEMNKTVYYEHIKEKLAS